ncbi:MAG: glycosyl hydrolase-related protein, partial [Peptostreptococcaceae bacterium]|nr:glycosyl hydrolase-related protein [Peptostreptococcaceae bacterium]
LNNPLKVEAGKAKEDVYSFLNIDNKYIEVDAVKRSEDGKTLVIRCHEYTGGKQKATITLDAKVKGWQESNLMEKPEGDHFISEAITLEFGPYEVKTVLVEL